jgi:hypothetical protein
MVMQYQLMQYQLLTQTMCHSIIRLLLLPGQQLRIEPHYINLRVLYRIPDLLVLLQVR